MVERIGYVTGVAWRRWRVGDVLGRLGRGLCTMKRAIVNKGCAEMIAEVRVGRVLETTSARKHRSGLPIHLGSACLGPCRRGLPATSPRPFGTLPALPLQGCRSRADNCPEEQPAIQKGCISEMGGRLPRVLSTVIINGLG